MRFKIDRDVLKSEVAKASGTVSAKESQPVLKNFLIKVMDGRLRIMSTDMNLGAITDLKLIDTGTNETTIFEEGAIAAPAQKIIEISESAPAGYIHFNVEGLVMTVLGGYRDVDAQSKPLDAPVSQSTWVIHCMDAMGFPDLPDWDAKSAITLEREPFWQGLDKVSFAAAKNELKKNLMAVYVNKGYMYAADGHRVCRMTFKSDQEIVDYSIPDKAVNLLVLLLKDALAQQLQMCKTDSYILFKVGADLYHVRKLAQAFPDVERVILKETEKYEHKLVVPRQQFTEVIKRAQVTSEENHQLSVKLEKDAMEQCRLTMSTKNTIDDRFEEVVEGKGVMWDSVSFNRAINWQYLLDVLEVLKDENLTIRMGDDKGRPTMFRIEEGDFVCIIMPLRIQKDNLGRDEKLHKRVAAHADSMRTKEVLGEVP